MAGSSGKTQKSKSPSIKVITIPRDILAKLEALPDKHTGTVFAPWEDEVIIRYANVKARGEIAKILGKERHQIQARCEKLKAEGKL